MIWSGACFLLLNSDVYGVLVHGPVPLLARSADTYTLAHFHEMAAAKDELEENRVWTSWQFSIHGHLCYVWHEPALRAAVPHIFNVLGGSPLVPKMEESCKGCV